MPTPEELAAGAAAPAPAPDSAAVSPSAAEPAAAAQADQPPAVEAPAAGTSSPTAGAEVAPQPEPTLLDQFDAEQAAKDAKPAAEAKPGEQKPDAKGAEAKPGEPANPAEPAPLSPVDYFKDVTVPESIRLDDAQRADVTGALDLLRAGKTSEGVTKLIGLHEQAMQAYATTLNKAQWDAFNDTRKGWRTDVMADPQLGGAGHQTAMGAVARMRDLAVSSHKPGTPEYEADRKSFDDFLRVTGAGDHPSFLRMLHNFARYFDEPALPPEGARPPPNPGHPAGESRRARMYPSMNNDRR